MKKAKIIIPLILIAVLLAFIVPVVIYTVTAEEIPPIQENESENTLLSEPTGAKIYLSITALKDIFGDLLGNPITQTTVTLLAVSIILILLAVLVNKSIKKRPGGGQVIVEKLVVDATRVYCALRQPLPYFCHMM